MAKTRAQISADWRKNNPEQHKKLWKKYYKRDAKKIAKRNSINRKNNPKYYGSSTIERLSSKEGWAVWKTASLRRSAKLRGHEFSITYLDIVPLIVEKCPILGVKLNYGVGANKGSILSESPSVDRIDNSKGYTKENIIIISVLANRIKSSLSLEELPVVLEKILDYYKNEKYKR